MASAGEKVLYNPRVDRTRGLVMDLHGQGVEIAYGRLEINKSFGSGVGQAC